MAPYRLDRSGSIQVEQLWFDIGGSIEVQFMWHNRGSIYVVRMLRLGAIIER